MGFPKQQQQVPGVQSAMNPVPDCGEHSYRDSGRLTGNARSSPAETAVSVAPWPSPVPAKAPTY